MGLRVSLRGRGISLSQSFRLALHSDRRNGSGPIVLPAQCDKDARRSDDLPRLLSVHDAGN